MRLGAASALLVVAAVLMVGAERALHPPLTAAAEPRGHLRPATPTQAASQTDSSVATEQEVREACGTACHRYPPPDILPRGMWRDTIARMLLISENQPHPTGAVGTAGRLVALPPEWQRVLRFYESHAPERLPDASPWPAADASRFRRHTFAPPEAPPDPAISHVRFVDLNGDGRLEIAAVDMRHGWFLSADPTSATRGLSALDVAFSPARFELFDLDRDGSRDLLIADLGWMLPEDHTDGSIVWMRGQEGGTFSSAFTLSGWPRVADVRAADFNGDGKPDLAVAAFGWRRVGHLTVLENRTTTYPRLEFHPHVLDERTGSIDVIPVDLNKDGHLDLVALISQEHETVMAYINSGQGFAFTPHALYTAPHPNWGSSGIQLVDLDGDGDLDVLVTNGDTFDDFLPKPYHGLMWLENRGTYPFTPHALADLPGVLRAEAADIDGDGDLDIVACAFIPPTGGSEDTDRAALVWLEQVKPGVFERRTLERGPARYATLNLADMDGDGDIDIVVGTFTLQERSATWVEVWENLTRRPER